MGADQDADRQILNRAAVGELLAVLGSEHVRAVLAKFLVDTRDRLGRVERAIADGRMAEVRDQLHMMKSTTATFGLVEVARLALEIETEAKRTTVDAARFAALPTTFERSVSMLLAAFPELG